MARGTFTRTGSHAFVPFFQSYNQQYDLAKHR